MYKILLVIALTISTNVFAQSRVIVTPLNPINCFIDEAPYVNWISNPKVEDTQNEAIVTFEVRYGSCHEGLLNIQDLDYTDIDLTPYGWRWPWSVGLFKISKSRLNSKAMILKIAFKKSKIFKKSNLRSFEMIAINGLLNFAWQIELIYNPEKDLTTLNMF